MSQINPIVEIETIEAALGNTRIVKIGDNVEIDTNFTTDEALLGQWLLYGPFIVVKIVIVDDEDFLYLAREKCIGCDSCEPTRVRAIAFK
jgi:hypothetical protein